MGTSTCVYWNADTAGCDADNTAQGTRAVLSASQPAVSVFQYTQVEVSAFQHCSPVVNVLSASLAESFSHSHSPYASAYCACGSVSFTCSYMKLEYAFLLYE